MPLPLRTRSSGSSGKDTSREGAEAGVLDAVGKPSETPRWPCRGSPRGSPAEAASSSRSSRLLPQRLAGPPLAALLTVRPLPVPGLGLVSPGSLFSPFSGSFCLPSCPARGVHRRAVLPVLLLLVLLEGLLPPVLPPSMTPSPSSSPSSLCPSASQHGLACRLGASGAGQGVHLRPSSLSGAIPPALTKLPPTLNPLAV